MDMDAVQLMSIRKVGWPNTLQSERRTADKLLQRASATHLPQCPEHLCTVWGWVSVCFPGWTFTCA